MIDAASAAGSGLEIVLGCMCAGSGCGGHLRLGQLIITSAGYQGAAQHTYTTACAGHHGPGPCPPSQPGPVAVPWPA